jgi:hypothetical protein
VWKGLGEKDSSDDEWEEVFKNPRQLEHAMELDSKVDI